MSSSAKQYNLKPYQVISQTGVSGDVTSAVTNIFFKDNVIYQYVWTGDLAGGFTVETSSDYNENTQSGTWDVVPIDAGAAAAGTADSGTIELNQLSAPYIRTVFTYSSGTGNLTVTISGKAV